MTSTIPKQGAEALLDAAEQLFLERGYANVSMQQIADAAGFTKGATYYHFQNKEELSLEVSRRILATLRNTLFAPFEREAPFEQQMREATRAVLDSIEGDLSRWLSDFVTVVAPEIRGKVIAEALGTDDWSLTMEPIFAQAAEHGHVRNVSPAAASRVYMKLLVSSVDEGTHLNSLTPLRPPDLDATTDEIVTIFLFGVDGTPW